MNRGQSGLVEHLKSCYFLVTFLTIIGELRIICCFVLCMFFFFVFFSHFLRNYNLVLRCVMTELKMSEKLSPFIYYTDIV